VYLKLDLRVYALQHMRAPSDCRASACVNPRCSLLERTAWKLAEFGPKQDSMLCYLGPVILYLISKIYVHIGRAYFLDTRLISKLCG